MLESENRATIGAQFFWSAAYDKEGKREQKSALDDAPDYMANVLHMRISIVNVKNNASVLHFGQQQRKRNLVDLSACIRNCNDF